MDSETVKGRPLTKEETRVLLELIETSKIITSKTTNATNNQLKNEEWVRLANQFNSTAYSPRTPQQLRLKWENLKKNARKSSTLIRMNQFKTGGGPPDYIPPDDILDRVSSLLGSTVSSFAVPFGGDREVAEGTVSDDSAYAHDNVSVGGEPVSEESYKETAVSMPINKRIETVVTDYHVLNVTDENVMVTPNKTKRLTFSTPRTVKKKFKPDESRTARNIALAEYYSYKKHCLEAKLTNINLENEGLKLNNEKLKLEIEKLKLELDKSKEK